MICQDRRHLFVTPLLAGVRLSDVYEKRLLNVVIALYARKGDRVIMTYVGLLENGTQFDRGQSEFVLGEKKVSFIRDCGMRFCWLLNSGIY